MAGGIAGGLAVWTSSWLAVGLAYGIAYGIAYGVPVGLAVGLAVGLPIGSLKEMGLSRGRTGQEPERLRLGSRRRGRAQHSPRASLKRFTSEFTSGLALGLAFGLMLGLVFGLAGGPAVVLAGGPALGLAGGPAVVLAGGPALGLAVGLVVGLVNVVVSALGDHHDPYTTTPWTLLTRDRAVTLVRTIAAALAVGLVGGLAVGLVVGLVAGFVIGTGRLAVSAWGSWLLFARLWLPLTGRLPWRPKRFLEDAYNRGVLRRTGAAYQFRHAQLRDHLAAARVSC